MRILFGMVQGAFKLPNCFLSQYVFNYFRIIMHVVRGNTRFIGQIELPQAVIAYDLASPLPTFWSEMHRIPIIVQGGHLVDF